MPNEILLGRGRPHEKGETPGERGCGAGNRGSSPCLLKTPFPTPTQKPPFPPYLSNVLEEGQWWVCLCPYRLCSPDCVRPALCPGKLTPTGCSSLGLPAGS